MIGGIPLIFLGLVYIMPQSRAETWALKTAFLVLALCVLAMQAVLSSAKRPAGVGSRAAGGGVAFLAFAAWASISIFWSGNAPRHAFESILLALSAVLLAAPRINISARHLSFTIIGIAGVEAIRVMLSQHGTALALTERMAGSFVNANHYAVILLAAYGIALAYALRRNGMAGFLLHLFAAILLASAVLSKSRSVLLGAMATLLTIAISGGGRMRKILAASVVAAAILLSPGMILGRLSDQVAGTEPFAFARTQIWASAARMIRGHPLGGVGLGAFGDYFKQFRPEKLYLMSTDYAHNEFVQVAAELGLIGVGLAIWALLALFARFRARLNPDFDQYPLAICLVPIAISAFFDFTLHVPVIAVAAILCLLPNFAQGTGSAVRGRNIPGFVLLVSFGLVLLTASVWAGLYAASQVAYARGARMFSAGNAAAAVPLFELSAKLGPNPEALVAIAACEMDPGRRETNLFRAIRLRHAWLPPRIDLFELCLARGDRIQCAEMIEEARKLDPFGLQPRLLDIRMAIETGRLKDARRDLNHAQTRWPNNVDLWFEEARIAEARGDRAAARRILETILSRHPGAVYARRWLNAIGSSKKAEGGN